MQPDNVFNVYNKQSAIRYDMSLRRFGLEAKRTVAYERAYLTVFQPCQVLLKRLVGVVAVTRVAQLLLFNLGQPSPLSPSPCPLLPLALSIPTLDVPFSGRVRHGLP
jgi:hypothetical protein